MSELKELLTYQNIDIRRGENTILKNININLHNAELIFILGESGSGKSSFLKSIYGALEVSGDYARVFDYDLLNIKRNELQYLRRNLGMVFQDFKIFEKLSVFENLDYFLRSINKKDKGAISAMLEKVGLSNKSEKKGFELSGGEKQRLSVARALIHKPKIIVADEPTGNLNKSLGIEIFKLLRDLAISQGSSIIAATHDENLPNIFSAKIYECKHQVLRKL